MILNQLHLRDIVCDQLQIMRGRPFKFEGYFKYWRCQQGFEEFTYGEFYFSWVGCVEQFGICHSFVSNINAEKVLLVPPAVIGQFKYAIDERKVCSGSTIYMIFTGSDRIQKLAPIWWFYCDRVKKNGKFPRGFRNVKEKFSLVGVGGKRFIAWAFYVRGKLYKVFNMEDGVWLEAKEITLIVPIGEEGCYLKRLHLCCLNGIVDKAMKRNIYL